MVNGLASEIVTHPSRLRGVGNSGVMKMNTTFLAVLTVLVLSLQIVCSQESEQRPRMSACTYDSDCTANAFCKDQAYCLCKVGHIVFKRPNGSYACLREATQLNDPCEESIQCTKPFGVDAVCYREAGCLCRVEAHFNEGRCYETSRLGGKCKVTNNCKIDSNIRVFCEKSICVCQEKYHPNSLGTDCLASKYIGETCDSDDHCLINNSYCADVCRCKIGFIASEDQLRCLKAAEKEGDHCEEQAQCNVFLENMRCLKGLCICEENYHNIPPDSVCWKSISVGEKCEDSKQCVVTSGNAAAVSCQQGTCKCSADYITDPADPKNCVQTKSGEARLLPHLLAIAILLSLVIIASMESDT